MKWLSQTRATIARRARVLGPWRLVAGLTFLVIGYAELIAQFVGRNVGHDDVTLIGLIAVMVHAIAANGGQRIIQIRSATTHIGSIAFVLFVLWAIDWIAIWRPRSPEDFYSLVYIFFVMLSATSILAFRPSIDEQPAYGSVEMIETI